MQVGVEDDRTDAEPEDDLDADDEDLGDDAEFLRAVAAAPDLRPPSGPPAGDRIGKHLGRFRIVEKLGQGGMGVVYAAEDEKLKRIVALKLLHEGEVQDGERKKRFLREARSASAVSHPSIAAVYEVGEEDGAVYIAMERVRGTSLRHRIAEGVIPVPEALRIASEIARALASAHAAGVVHRDLKPDNVMLTGGATQTNASLAGASGVKVLDFGLAKILHARPPSADGRAPDASSSNDALTQEGRILGTPSYMSPEQASGRPTDARADVFSFGVLLYEMVTGTRPFTGGTVMDILVAINRDEPELASRKNRAVPSALAQLIARCLEKDPDDRPADCGEVAAELDVVARGGERKLRWREGAMAIAVVGVVVAMVASTRTPARDRGTSTAVPTAEPVVTTAAPTASPGAVATQQPPAPSTPAASSARPVPVVKTARPQTKPPVPDPFADQK